MNDKAKKRNLEQLNRRYQQRITLAKNGQEAFRSGDFINAIKYYNSYLKTLSDIKEVSEKKLSPVLFNKETELSEMLLISHVYWDLCKIYDRAPNLRSEFDRCLKQFALFSIGMPYQVVNSEMLRKFIRAGRCLNKIDFQEAYKQIGVSSKKCYIATHVFGEEHENTQILRKFKKDILNQSKLGTAFIHNYYKLSYPLTNYAQNRPIFDKIFIRPFFTLGLTLLSAFFKLILRK